MNTNHVGDIAEQAVILQALELSWGVSRPIGNSLPYDLILDVNGELARVQVKSAWVDKTSNNYIVDNRRTKTNRRKMVRDNYSVDDFDFAIVYLPELKVFYVFPVAVFVGYGSTITIVEEGRRQRKPRSAEYREAWFVIEAAKSDCHT